MSRLDTLTEAQLAAALPGETLAAARNQLGRVLNPVRSGDTLSGHVRSDRSYRVELELVGDRIQGSCNCSYGRTGLCVHAAALLLKWIRDPGAFLMVDEAPPGGEAAPIDTVAAKPPPARKPEAPPEWMSVSFVDRRERDEARLEQWLGAVNLQDLRSMARERGWHVKGTRKAEVARQVQAQMVDPESLRQTLAGLDAEHRAVFRAIVLVASDMIVSEEELARMAEIWAPLKTYKQFDTYKRHLRKWGLTLPGEVRRDFPSWNDFCPRALARYLPPVLDGSVPAADSLPASMPAAGLRLADPLFMVRAAGQMVVLLEQMRVPLRPPWPRPRLEQKYSELKDWDYVPTELARAIRQQKIQNRIAASLAVRPPRRALPDEALERLAPLAGGEAQVDFLYALLVSAGLLYPGSPTTVWPEVKLEYLRRGEVVQRGILGRAYAKLVEWTELWELLRREDGLKLMRNWRNFYGTPAQLRSTLANYRGLVLRCLASLPDGQWVLLRDFLGLMQALWPDFDAGSFWQHDDSRVSQPWYLAYEGEPLRPGDGQTWDLAQGSFIREILTGPLHWLGFADLYFEGERPVAFRLHGLADLVWDRAEAPPLPRHTPAPSRESAAAGAVTLDDLTIEVDPSAVSAQAHHLLDQIARLEVAGAERFVYRLDARATYESFEHGTSLPDLLEEWDEVLPVPVSEAIRAKLSAWWAAYGRVRIYDDLTVVEFGDEFALAEVKGVASLEQYLVAEISPRLIIIRPEGVAPLVAELERAGYTPKVAGKA